MLTKKTIMLCNPSCFSLMSSLTKF